MRQLRLLTFLLMAMALHTQAQTVIWTTGTYSYDGSGNIRSIGTDGYTYDAAGRLKSATLVMPGGMTPTQTFTYDSLGNLTSIDTTPNLPTYLKTEPIPVNSATNRLTGRTYDAAGNVTVDGVEAYEWDATGAMIARRVTGEEDWLYLYTATDERIAVFRGELKAAGQSGFLTTPTKVSWTIRDLDAKPMAVWESSGGTYGLATITWKRDYVWGFGRLMATIDATGTRHVHTDHLGTPRLITNASGAIVEEHEYYPFGFEATTEGTEPIKFTGHERDLEPYSVNDLDYMHARYYSPVMGRFLSIDPVGGSRYAPQSWNRYAYVLGNPVNLIDPYGLREAQPGEQMQPGDTCNGTEVDGWCTGDTITVTAEDPWQEYYQRMERLRLWNPLGRGIRSEIENLRHLEIRDFFGNTPEEIASASDYGRCVQENRLDPALAVAALGSAMPKRLLPPWRVPYPDQPYTTPSSVVAHYLKPVAPKAAQALRTGGRAVSRVATPLTLAEGAYDWVVLVGCASR